MNLSPEVRIERRAGLTPDEIARVNQLVDGCNRYENLDLPLDVSAESTPLDRSRQFLALSGDRLIGFLLVQEGDESEVCLAVDPERRRRGVGRRLLDAWTKEARQEGRTSWLLVTEEAAASGREFVAAMGATYRISEYRMVLDPAAVPLARDWPTMVQLGRGSVDSVELISQLVATSFGDPIDKVRGWVGLALILENHRFDIGYVAGVPIGIIRTNYYGSDIYVTAFSVIPERRGRGFGRQMLLQTIDRLLREQWSKILIEVATENRNALGLYLSCGFKEVATYGYYEQSR